MKPRALSKCRLCLLLLSPVLLVLGIVLQFLGQSALDYILQKSLVLTPDSPTFAMWKELPMKFAFDMYFYNWSNPEDIRKKGVKPRFQEIGPYRFLEHKEKADIVWHDNGTVSYRNRKWWWYDKEFGSNLQESVTTLNPLAITAAHAARHWGYFMRKGLSLSLSTMVPGLNVTRSVSQMSFEGYEDPILNIAKTFPFLAGKSIPRWDRFGWFYNRNGSESFEGLYNMGTGVNSEYGKLYSWNNWNEIPYYDKGCAPINGSAGELFKPYPTRTQITFFSSDLCRTATLDYVEDVMVDGMLGLKFSMDNSMLDNGTLYPKNKCYCNQECTPSGIFNVSACRYGSPVFVSLPHFFKADPYYLNSVEGLTPDKSKHEFYMILEPTLGIPLEVSARLQLNILLHAIPGVTLLNDVPRIFFPMMWFEQKVKVPSDKLFQIKILLNLPVIFSGIGVTLIVLGLCILAFVIHKLCTINICGKKNKKKSNKFDSSYEQTLPLNKPEGKNGFIVKKT